MRQKPIILQNTVEVVDCPDQHRTVGLRHVHKFRVEHTYWVGSELGTAIPLRHPERNETPDLVRIGELFPTGLLRATNA